MTGSSDGRWPWARQQSRHRRLGTKGPSRQVAAWRQLVGWHRGAGLRRVAPSLRRAVLRRVEIVGRQAQAGMTTAEYAVGTIAAVSFAVVLIAVVKSGAVRSALTGIITTALGLGH